MEYNPNTVIFSYPYDYVDSEEKFHLPIPGPECFFNSLTNEHITPEKYSELLKICEIFGVTTLGMLHDLYVRLDTLILCSVFENYREMGMMNYKLDPAHFISAPAYTWSAMLLHTGVHLELISDPHMYRYD